MKTLRSDRRQKSPQQHFSIPSPSEIKVPSKEPTTISHSSETKWQNNGGMKNMSSLENQIFHQNDLGETAKRETFASLTTQHLRSRREIDAILESPIECANFTYTIKYEDNYRVWNNFSLMYQSRMYVCMYVNFYLKVKRKKKTKKNDASLISYKLVSMRGVGTHLNK